MASNSFWRSLLSLKSDTGTSIPLGRLAFLTPGGAPVSRDVSDAFSRALSSLLAHLSLLSRS